MHIASGKAVFYDIADRSNSSYGVFCHGAVVTETDLAVCLVILQRKRQVTIWRNLDRSLELIFLGY
jgi:hypothetical protein